MGIFEAVLIAISGALILSLFLVPAMYRVPGYKQLKCYCKHTAEQHGYTCNAQDPHDYGTGYIANRPCFCMRSKGLILSDNFWSTILNRKRKSG